MAPRTVSLRRFTPPLPLELPIPYQVRAGALHATAPRSEGRPELPPGTPLVVVLWHPNLRGEPPLRVTAARAGEADPVTGAIPVPGLEPRPGEHVLHVQPVPPIAANGEEERF